MFELHDCLFFHESLTFEETEILLRDTPEGTFLARHSTSKPGCLVMAYKTETDVAQCLLAPTNDHTWQLEDGTEYLSVSDVIEKNQSLLLYPLLVSDK